MQNKINFCDHQSGTVFKILFEFDDVFKDKNFKKIIDILYLKTSSKSILFLPIYPKTNKPSDGILIFSTKTNFTFQPHSNSYKSYQFSAKLLPFEHLSYLILFK